MPADSESSRSLMATVADIDAAGDDATLRSAVQQAQQAVAAGLSRHMPTQTLAACWSEAIRSTVATAARLVAAAGDGPQPRWTWFVSGSGGRGEAVPGSDVETLVSLTDDTDDAGKTRALALAAEVHALLESCGMQLDDNGVLGSRPRFCRRDASWVEGVERWAAQPELDRGVVMLGLVADAWSVTATERRERLRPHVIDAAGRHPGARKAMLQDATWVRASVPSRLRIFAMQADRADLKAAVIDPIVKIARWGALSAGSAALTTLERLDDAAAASVIDADDAASLRDSYVALSRIRWQRRSARWLAGEKVDDIVSMSQLAPQARALVRTAAREVNGVRRKLHFLSSIPR
ncbi:putative nucleotidyltransferase substrate binding domain-containing protein [Mycolicibacterium sp. CBM1]